MTARIQDLDCSQLARHAFNVFLLSGRHHVGARLVYRALELDPRQGEALRCLSDLLNADGTEVFSAVVLEYALSDCVGLEGPDRQVLDDLRFLAKWSWGFSRHHSGQGDLPQDAFEDRSAFATDEKRYREFLDALLAEAGSLESGFHAAHTLCGTLGRLLTHKTLGERAGVGECLHPERFEKTPAYDEWLRSDTDELDRLEAERRKQASTQH